MARTKGDVINEKTMLRGLLDKISAEIDACCDLAEHNESAVTPIGNQLRTLRSECLGIVWALESGRKAVARDIERKQILDENLRG